MSPLPALAQSFDRLSSTQDFSHSRSGTRRPAPVPARRIRNSRSSVSRSLSQKPPATSAGARRTVMLVASTGMRSAVSAHSNAAGASRDVRDARLARGIANELDGGRQHADELGIRRQGGERHREPAGPIGIVGIEESDDLAAFAASVRDCARCSGPEIALGGGSHGCVDRRASRDKPACRRSRHRRPRSARSARPPARARSRSRAAGEPRGYKVAADDGKCPADRAQLALPQVCHGSA